MTSLTAPGQITVDEMTGRYALGAVGPQTSVYVHITASDRDDRDVLDRQDRAASGTELHVRLRTTPDDVPDLAARVAQAVPGVNVEIASHEARLTALIAAFVPAHIPWRLDLPRG